MKELGDKLSGCRNVFWMLGLKVVRGMNVQALALLLLRGVLPAERGTGHGDVANPRLQGDPRVYTQKGEEATCPVRQGKTPGSAPL